MAWGGEPWGSAPFGGDAAAPTGPGPVSLDAAGVAAADASVDLSTPKPLAGTAGVRADAVGALASGSVPLSASGSGNADAGAPLSGGADQPAAMRWRPVVMIGGVDFSYRLTGTITVDYSENAASVADLSILPFAGTLLPQDWIGRPVTIDYADKLADGLPANARRLFTGIIDVPSLDSETSVLTLRCTDDFQGKVSAMPHSVLDDAIGGWWSAALSDETDDTWIYAQDRLLSVPSSMELDRYGNLRVTPWAAKSTADFTLGDGSMMAAGFEFAPRSQYISTVNIEFDYRFPRLKKRVVGVGYSYPFSLDQIMINGYSIPSRDMIRQAINGTGWEVTAEPTFTPCPAAPQPPVNLGGGVFGVWAIGPDVAEALTFGFVAGLRKRYVQSVTHGWRIEVRNLALVSALGKVETTLRASLESGFDASAWENYRSVSVTPGLWEVSGPPQPMPLIADPESQGETYVDGSTGAADDPTAAAYAVQTAMAQAQVMIAGAMRGSSVRIEMPIRPLMDCAATVSISCRNGDAKGKVRLVRHRLDMLAGRATTEAEIAISTLMGVGYSHPHTAPFCPPAPVPPPVEDAAAPDGLFTFVGSSVTSGALNDSMLGFFTNVSTASPSYLSSAPVYPDQFAMRSPEIEAEHRNNATIELFSSAEAGIAEDLFLPVVS